MLSKASNEGQKMAADWTDDHRRAWAINGVEEEIRNLRGLAKRARLRFGTQPLYLQPGTWCAECYEAAADAMQECINDLPQPEVQREGSGQ
jgi:hypothetical protein